MWEVLSSDMQYIILTLDRDIVHMSKKKCIIIRNTDTYDIKPGNLLELKSHINGKIIILIPIVSECRG